MKNETTESEIDGLDERKLYDDGIAEGQDLEFRAK